MSRPRFAPTGQQLADQVAAARPPRGTSERTRAKLADAGVCLRPECRGPMEASPAGEICAWCGHRNIS